LCVIAAASAVVFPIARWGGGGGVGLVREEYLPGPCAVGCVRALQGRDCQYFPSVPIFFILFPPPPSVPPILPYQRCIGGVGREGKGRGVYRILAPPQDGALSDRHISVFYLFSFLKFPFRPLFTLARGGFFFSFSLDVQYF